MSEKINYDDPSNDSVSEAYTTIIQNQDNIIENQQAELEELQVCAGVLSGIFFCCIIAIGISLAFKIGKWLYGLIWC